MINPEENILLPEFHRWMHVTLYNGPPETITVPYDKPVYSGNEYSILAAMKKCGTHCFSCIVNPSDAVILEHLKNWKHTLLKNIKIQRTPSKYLIKNAILLNSENFKDYKEIFDDSEIIEFLHNDPFIIEDITDPSDEMIKIAVEKKGRLIQHITNQTLELCVIAVTNIVQDPGTYYIHDNFISKIKYWNSDMVDMIINDKRLVKNINVLPNLSASDITKAILINPLRLEFFQTIIFDEELYDKAFNINCKCIKFIPHDFQTDSMHDFIKTNDPSLIQYLKNKTSLDFVNIVAKNYWNIQYVPEEFQTIEMCKTVVKYNYDLLKYCFCINKELLNNIFKSRDPNIPRKDRFNFIRYYNEDVLIRILKADSSLLRVLSEKEQTDKLVIETLESDGYGLQYVLEPTQEQIDIAVKNQPKAIKYIK